MDKKRGFLFLVFLILLVIPLVSAGDYDAGTYSSGLYGAGEVAAAPDSPGGGGNSGGSSSGVTTTPTPECSQSSDCGENKYCFENKCYEGECFDDSVCNVEEGETCWDFRCVKLFDIEILEFESPVKLGEFFDFTYFMKGMADINGDVEINFWIEQDGNIVTSGSDVIYMGSFEEKTKTKKLFLPSDIISGTYEFFIKLDFETYTVDAHRTIEIIVGKEGLVTIKFSPEIGEFRIYIIAALIGLAVFIILLVFYFERRKIRAGIVKEGRWIKKHKVSILVFLLFLILGVLVYYLKWYELITFSSINSFFANLVSWFKINVLPYFSPTHPYFYYVIGSIAGLLFLLILIIIVKATKKKRSKSKWKKP